MKKEFFVLCGEEWLEKHRNNITQEHIDKLGIEIIVDKKKLCNIQQGGKKGKVGAIMKDKRQKRCSTT